MKDKFHSKFTLIVFVYRYKDHSTAFWKFVRLFLLALWAAYFIGSMYYHFKFGWDPTNEPAIRLIAINVLAVFCVTYWAIKKYHGRKIWKSCPKPCTTGISNFLNKYWHILQW